MSLVTLGVDDLERSRRFYEAMGWRGQTVAETVFFQAGGLALVLWSRARLADDAGTELGDDRAAFDGMALAQNVRSRQEVDEIIEAAERAGGAVTRTPAETSYGGYAGYFADPDGHLWEVAHNPHFTLAGDGSLTIPDFGSS